jgi:hypothetical protein
MGRCFGSGRTAACSRRPIDAGQKSSSGKLPARGSRFRSYDEQTTKPEGIPPHRTRHLSRFARPSPLHPCMRASPQCHELPLQPTHAVVLKFLHELYVLVVTGTDSRVHLMRILAQHRAHGGARPPCSLDLEPVSPCHSSCTSPCTRFSNNPRA